MLRFTNYSDKWLEFVISNRKNDKVNNIHDYDIEEGPVADDAIATQIDIYLAGGISKEKFINKLHFKHHISHQIAFCTAKSLLMIEKPFEKIDLNEMTIDNAITQSLVVDYNYSEVQALDFYFQSQTYRQLTDETTKLFEIDWKEIYALLRAELNLK